MGFKQTESHRFGKSSYHQVGLVRGQFGNVDMEKWVKFLADVGFDGWEEASWELDLRKCDTDAGAEAYARERLALAKKFGLEIFTVATHLQGQVLGDEPTARTLNFYQKSEAGAAYKAWRDKGIKPPRTNPLYLPDEVGKLLHDQAAKDLLACVRLAHHLGKEVDALCAMAQHKKVMVKIGAFYALGKKEPPYTDLAPMIRKVVKAFGVRRCMWESDSPFQIASHKYEDSIDLVRKRVDFLTDDDRDWLLRRTVEEFFFKT